MKPLQLANQLRIIATAIDNSKKPRRDLVAAELKKVLSRVASGDFEKVTSEVVSDLMNFLSEKGIEATGPEEDPDSGYPRVYVPGAYILVTGTDEDSATPGATVYESNGCIVEEDTTTFADVLQIVSAIEHPDKE